MHHPHYYGAHRQTRHLGRHRSCSANVCRPARTGAAGGVAYQSARAHIDDVGGVLRRVDADVLALIEVEHCGVAARVAAALGSASGGGGGTVNYDETAHRTFVAASQDTSHNSLVRRRVSGVGTNHSVAR